MLYVKKFWLVPLFWKGVQEYVLEMENQVNGRLIVRCESSLGFIVACPCQQDAFNTDLNRLKCGTDLATVGQ